MGKHSKRDHKVEKDGKKRKREETASRVPAQEEGAPFLFGGKTSSDLDDVFGKSVSLGKDQPSWAYGDMSRPLSLFLWPGPHR
jgi:hypothetical protein